MRSLLDIIFAKMGKTKKPSKAKGSSKSKPRTYATRKKMTKAKLTEGKTGISSKGRVTATTSRRKSAGGGTRQLRKK